MSKVRTTARRDDWKTEPLPQEHETFVQNRSFSKEEMDVLRHGSETYDTLEKTIPLASRELLEAIKTRHSVRRYKDQPIERHKVEAIRAEVERINAAYGLNVQLVLDEPKAFSGMFITTYGQFSGVSNYIVLAAPKGKAWEEKVGYYGEQLVLLAQTLGLNTCWVGLTYKKIPEAYTLRDGDIIHCVISLGYGENQGKQHPLKPIGKFYETSGGDVPQWFTAGVEAALLAPTAVNQQKFKFILHPGKAVEARALFSVMGYTMIDLGIAKCHFEIGAGKDSFIWK